MRKTFIHALFAISALSTTGIFLGSCNQSSSSQTDSTKSNTSLYGQKFDKTIAIDVDSALANWQSHTKSVIVKGISTAVCQTEGCWFKYKTATEDLFVDFDHQFKIEKNSVGKSMYATGYFYQDTVSVEMLQEWAKDDGKTVEEIAAIKEPKIELHFRAVGVEIE